MKKAIIFSLMILVSSISFAAKPNQDFLKFQQGKLPSLQSIIFKEKVNFNTSENSIKVDLQRPGIAIVDFGCGIAIFYGDYDDLYCITDWGWQKIIWSLQAAFC